LDASAVPLTRVGGLTAATQSFHAQDRARRTSAEEMSDGAGGGQAGSFALPMLGDFGSMLKRGDIALAIGVMAILVVLIVPLPATLRGIVERFRAQTAVLSQAEIHPRARLKTVGAI